MKLLTPEDESRFYAYVPPSPLKLPHQPTQLTTLPAKPSKAAQ